jgi:SOS response regulatory protein OraA/RecX
MLQEKLKEEDRGSEEVKYVKKFCVQHNWIDETNFEDIPLV